SWPLIDRPPRVGPARRNRHEQRRTAGSYADVMRLGLCRAVPLVAACSAIALSGATTTAAAQSTGCGFTRLAASAAPESNVRSALRCLVNATRVEHGLQPLRPSSKLNLAADRHSADMVARGYFAHVTPEGRSVAD